MKKIIAAIAIATLTAGAYAACSSQTYFRPDGTLVICNVCCDSNNNCQTFCF